MLRNVADGTTRAITSINTEKFIKFAPSGAVIRIQNDNLDGSDTGASYLHSFILVDKDDKGCWLYESTDPGIYLRYFTWSEFASKYSKYKYFKYIKWPGAEAYSERTIPPTNVMLTTDKNTYPLSSTITFTATGNNVSYYTLVVENSGGTQVYRNLGFSKNATWTPLTIDTYTATLTGYNDEGTVVGMKLSIPVYDSTPKDDPEIKMNTSEPFVGQTVDIEWGTIVNAITYVLEISKDGQLVYSETENDCSYSSLLAKGEYIAKLTASNPYGETSNEVKFTVSDTTYSGDMGDTVSWSLNTATGVFAMSGYGEAINKNSTETTSDYPDWYEYCKYVKSVDINYGITHIPTACFYGFENVKEYDIPSSVISIGAYAFANNASITEMEIGKNISFIGNSVFLRCSNLITVNYKPIDVTPISNAFNPFQSCHKDLIVYFLGMYVVIPDINTGISSSFFSVTANANGGVFKEIDEHYDWYYLTGKSDIMRTSRSLVNNGEYVTYGYLPTATREGFIFDGWHTKSDGGYKLTSDDELFFDYSHTLYAQWIPETFDIELNTDIGTGVESTQEKYWSTYANLPELNQNNFRSRMSTTVEDEKVGFSTISTFSTNKIGDSVQTAGYEFDGWYTGEYGGIEITDETLVELDGPQQLYPQWIDRNIRIESLEINKERDTLGYAINGTADNLNANLKIAYYDSENRKIFENTLGIDLVKDNGSVALNDSVDYAFCEVSLLSITGQLYAEVATVFPFSASEGVFLSGEVVSYNPQNKTILKLYQGDELKDSITIDASTGSGAVTQSFAFENVVAGIYSLEVTKAQHTSYTITDVVVAEDDIDLTMHSNNEINTISMLCGDINGDGSINQEDLGVIWDPSNYNKNTKSANDIHADLDGDGMINQFDVGTLWLPDYYNKGSVYIQYNS